MTSEEISQTLREARRSQNAVDEHVGEMVRLIAGRLRHARQCSSSLKRLKRELQDFDMRTYQWKER